jgi:hypothetical protein
MLGALPDIKKTHMVILGVSKERKKEEKEGGYFF